MRQYNITFSIKYLFQVKNKTDKHYRYKCFRFYELQNNYTTSCTLRCRNPCVGKPADAMMRYMKIPHVDDPVLRSRAVRYVTIVLLALYCVLGLATTALTTWLSMRRTYSCSFMSEYFTSVYVLLAGALFLVVTSSQLLFKVCNKTRGYVVSMYIFVLAVTLSLELISPIIAHIHTRIIAKGRLRNDMIAVFTNFRGHDENVECIEKTQMYHHCCGATNFTDLLPRNFTVFSGTFGLMPKSCVCDSSDDDGDGFCVISDPDSSERIFGIPCYLKVWKDLKIVLFIVRVISPLTAVAQVALLLAVSCIIRRLQRSNVVGVYLVKRHSAYYRQGAAVVSVPGNNVTLNHTTTAQGGTPQGDGSTSSQSGPPGNNVTLNHTTTAQGGNPQGDGATSSQSAPPCHTREPSEQTPTSAAEMIYPTF